LFVAGRYIKDDTNLAEDIDKMLSVRPCTRHKMGYTHLEWLNKLSSSSEWLA
jgi:hypothetical protein